MNSIQPIEANGQKHTPLDWALTYHERGYCPIPIPFRSKIPPHDEWQNSRYGREELEKHFSGRTNIGIVLGAPSDHLVDVDLDHPLAVELAPEFLPDTGSKFGRAGKPCSHWLYLATRPAATKKFQFPKSGARPETDGKMIVEFRSTGCQTVFPGSVHESGEPIEWASDGDPAEVDPDELLPALDWLRRKVCRRLGYAADDAIRKPLNGSPHNGAPATSGLVRCRKYLPKLPPAISGSGGHNATYNAACWCWRFGLSAADAWTELAKWNATHARPPWSEKELRHKLDDARAEVVGAGEFGLMLHDDRPAAQVNSPTMGDLEDDDGQHVEPPAPVNISKLIVDHPRLNEPLIEGILRRGETMNIIAASKIGKSWLAYLLTLATATGQPWLNRFVCRLGRVLYIDNELHPQTLAHRVPTSAQALELHEADYAANVDVLSLRGRLTDLYGIKRLLEAIEPGQYDLVVLDAFYRALPDGVNENDNASVAMLYNTEDQITARLNCGWVNIHHSSKGSQADKAITDVGSGAGSQSRAADAHIILRPHEEDGAVVLEGVVRSFKPMEPLTLRWNFPLWTPDDGLDPALVKGRGTKGEERQSDKDREGIDKIAEALKGGPLTRSLMRGRTGLSDDRLKRLLDRMEYEEKVSWQIINAKGNNCREYRLAGSNEKTLSADVVGLSAENGNVGLRGVGCGPIT